MSQRGRKSEKFYSHRAENLSILHIFPPFSCFPAEKCARRPEEAVKKLCAGHAYPKRQGTLAFFSRKRRLGLYGISRYAPDGGFGFGRSHKRRLSQSTYDNQLNFRIWYQFFQREIE